MKKIFTTSEDGYYMGEEAYMVQNNVLTVVAPRGSATIYVCKL
jgi:hypothetical protein